MEALSQVYFTDLITFRRNSDVLSDGGQPDKDPANSVEVPGYISLRCRISDQPTRASASLRYGDVELASDSAILAKEKKFVLIIGEYHDLQLHWIAKLGDDYWDVEERKVDSIGLMTRVVMTKVEH